MPVGILFAEVFDVRVVERHVSFIIVYLEFDDSGRDSGFKYMEAALRLDNDF